MSDTKKTKTFKELREAIAGMPDGPIKQFVTPDVVRHLKGKLKQISSAFQPSVHHVVELIEKELQLFSFTLGPVDNLPDEEGTGSEAFLILTKAGHDVVKNCYITIDFEKMTAGTQAPLGIGPSKLRYDVDAVLHETTPEEIDNILSHFVNQGEEGLLPEETEVVTESESAHAAAHAHLAAINAHLEAIGKTVKNFTPKHADKTDWGHVGSLAAIHQHLKHLPILMPGHKVEEGADLEMPAEGQLDENKEHDSYELTEARMKDNADMQRSHFEHIAHIVHSAPVSDEHRHVMASHFADHLSHTNPGFKKEHFVKAATNGIKTKGSSMQRRHFEHIARTIKSLPVSDEHKLAVAKHFSGHLATTNPQFSSHHFVKAAAGEGYKNKSLRK